MAIEVKDPVRVFFLHHSTGRILVRDGGVRARLAEIAERGGPLIELWDHDYNAVGLTGPDGQKTGESWSIPEDNTNPDGFDALFHQPVHTPPDNAFSKMLEFDVIVFKPCFPICAIKSAEQLSQYKKHYLAVREVIAQHPDKLFIALTPPPLSSLPIVSRLVPSGEQWTTPADARRARSFSRWLASTEFLSGLPNLATFDLFDLLAAPEGSGSTANTLRREYRSGKRGVIGLDSHPNKRGAQSFAGPFVDFLVERIENFWPQTGRAVAASSQHTNRS